MIMATLKSNPIYTTLAQNLDYVRSAHSTVPPDAVATVARYIEGDHANMLFAKAYDCSLNPELAAEQMLADRERYLHNRKAEHLSGQTEDKHEILAHHFYLSFHQCDDISIEEAVRINEEIFTCAGIIGNYRVLTAPHTNTDEQHVHTTVNSYHKDEQRKYCMNNKERYRLWAIADYVCVEHGLSIVENPKLLAYDAEYREWFSRIKTQGHVVIHPSLSPKQKAKQANERMRKKEQPPKHWTISREIEKEVYEHMRRSEKEENERKSRLTRYYDGRYPSHYYRNRGYSATLYSPTGRKRGILELSLILVGVAAFGMQVHSNLSDSRGEAIMRFERDKRAQAIMDGIAMTRLLGVNRPSEIAIRLDQCGQDMNSVKRELKAQPDNEVYLARLHELKVEYRNLKHLQAIYLPTRMPEYSQQYYCKVMNRAHQTAEVAPESKKQSFNDLVVGAQNRTAQNAKYKAEKDFKDR